MVAASGNADAYGLEDVKTTDPISNPRYLRLLLGYLRIDPGDPTLLALDVAAGQGERGEQANVPALPAE